MTTLMHAKRLIKRSFPRLIETYRRVRSSLRRLRESDRKAVFVDIARDNVWGDPDSVSGTGSNLQQTAHLRRELGALLADLQVRSMLDAPCGDFHWMRHVDLSAVSYTGVDVVPGLIAKCNADYAGANRRFALTDITADDLPAVDLIFSRDCLVHFSYEQIWTTLRNMARSGSRYLLTTTFPGHGRNWDIATGDWRPLNLEAAPFEFPQPLRVINEQCTEGDGEYEDKSLALWRLADLEPVITRSAGR